MKPLKMIINVQTNEIENIVFTDEELIEIGWTYDGDTLVPPPLPVIDDTVPEN